MWVVDTRSLSVLLFQVRRRTTLLWRMRRCSGGGGGVVTRAGSGGRRLCRPAGEREASTAAATTNTHTTPPPCKVRQRTGVVVVIIIMKMIIIWLLLLCFLHSPWLIKRKRSDAEKSTGKQQCVIRITAAAVAWDCRLPMTGGHALRRNGYYFFKNALVVTTVF